MLDIDEKCLTLTVKAVVGLNLLCPKSFQKQFGEFFKRSNFRQFAAAKLMQQS